MSFMPPDAVPPFVSVNPSRATDQPEYVILIAEVPEAPSGFRFPLVKANPDGHLRVARAPNSPVTFQKFTPNTQVPTRLDIGFLGANRDMLTVHNTSDKDLYLHLGFTVSQTLFTTVLAGDPAKGPKFWSVPLSNPFYGGEVWGVWPESGAGGASCVELT